jgi:hypothetical protein
LARRGQAPIHPLRGLLLFSGRLVFAEFAGRRRPPEVPLLWRRLFSVRGLRPAVIARRRRGALPFPSRLGRRLVLWLVMVLVI